MEYTKSIFVLPFFPHSWFSKYEYQNLFSCSGTRNRVSTKKRALSVSGICYWRTDIFYFSTFQTILKLSRADSPVLDNRNILSDLHTNTKWWTKDDLINTAVAMALLFRFLLLTFYYRKKTKFHGCGWIDGWLSCCCC